MYFASTALQDSKPIVMAAILWSIIPILFLVSKGLILRVMGWRWNAFLTVLLTTLVSVTIYVVVYYSLGILDSFTSINLGGGLGLIIVYVGILLLLLGEVAVMFYLGKLYHTKRKMLGMIIFANLASGFISYSLSLLILISIF